MFSKQLTGISSMNLNEMNNEIIYNNLVNLGNFYGLKSIFDGHLFRQQLEEFKDDWVPYNPSKPYIGRDGLSLTSIDGKMTGEELTSLREYNHAHGTQCKECDFNKPTRALERLTSLRQSIAPFLPHLGRTHLIRFKKGAYFPPHRDSQQLGTDSFRIICLLFNCDPTSFHFIYDEEKIHLEHGKFYFMNTKVAHSLMSYCDGAMIFVANVLLSKESAECVMNNLECD